MAKYLVQFRYVGDGVKGLLKEGGSKRRDAVEQLIKGMGGTLETFYFSFGEYDGLCIVDAPDNIGTAASTLLVNASGAVQAVTTVLLTPEEVDEATKRTAAYRPPGQ
jgi:uncharacterized protein with GYD domain